MVQFQTNYFRYKGIESKKYNIVMCTIGDEDREITNGVNRNLQEIEGLNGLKTITNITDSYIDFEVGLAKIDNNNNIIPFTFENSYEINNWLFNTVDYETLEFNDFSVKCIITKGSKWANSNQEGYLKVNIHCEPFMRAKRIIKRISTNDSISFDLENKGNYGLELDVNLQIKLSNATTMFSIKNLNNGTQIKLENLWNGEKFLKYYGDLNQLEDSLDGDNNVAGYTTKRDWLTLDLGVNNILIETDGKADVVIEYQPRLQFM